MSVPADLVFGHDGNLYVDQANQVLRYNGATGAFIGVFATGNGIGNGITFGPDGNLYASVGSNGTVLRFNGTTGASMGVFTSGGNLTFPLGVTFGPDGNLYVTENRNPGVSEMKRFNGTTGAFIDTFTTGGSVIAPFASVFGPDGNLYVGSAQGDSVQRFNGTTGAFVNIFASGGGQFGQDGIHYLTFHANVPNSVPEPNTVALLAGCSVMGAAFLLRKISLRDTPT